jgi:hypothetical protein
LNAWRGHFGISLSGTNDAFGRQLGGNSRFVAIEAKANYLISLQGWVAEWLKAPVLKCATYCFSCISQFLAVPSNPRILRVYEGPTWKAYRFSGCNFGCNFSPAAALTPFLAMNLIPALSRALRILANVAGHLPANADAGARLEKLQAVARCNRNGTPGQKLSRCIDSARGQSQHCCPPRLGEARLGAGGDAGRALLREVPRQS